MLATIIIGLDCHYMSSFDNSKLDTDFFSDGKNKSFLIYAVDSNIFS